MVRLLAILALAAVCFALSTANNTIEKSDPIKGQRWVENLLGYIYQHVELDPEIREIVHDWDIEDNIGDNRSEWQVKNRKLWSSYKSGMLPRGRIYAVHYPHLLEEAILIFEAICHAPSYTDLVGIIYWAHTHLNQGQFNYAVYVALIHSPATRLVTLPRPYQIGPEYFFNTDTMRQVDDFKMGLIYGGDKTENDNEKIVEGKYTSWYIKDTLDNENGLTYFMEDIGLNDWYCYFNVRYPFWMSSEEYVELLPEFRGQIYYYTHKLILNRYLLERLSLGLGDMDSIDWNEEISVGYSPYMTYRNGMHFPRRPERTRIPVWKKQELEQLREFESRISQVADSGYMMTKDGQFENVRTEEGFNKFANLVQGNKDSMNKDFYGSVDFFGRRIVGFSPKPQNPYQVLPSALENSSTSLRDPGFYSLLQKIKTFFSRYMKGLGPYTREELASEGVKIGSVNIVEQQLVTYFEPVETLIETLTYTDHRNVTHTTEIKVRQKRLNHKPFTYNIIIDSEKDVNASVRIFIGPKYNIDGKEASDNYDDFYQTDYFDVDLKKGSNTILRKSTKASWFAPDFRSIKFFEGFIDRVEKFDEYQYQFGIPEHLALPRGKVDGMPIQFFFYVSEITQDSSQRSTFKKKFGNEILGFPMNRPISDFSLPNMRFLDAMIYHEKL